MTAPGPTAPGQHAVELTAELRQLADALLDRVEPWLLAAARHPASTDTDTCGWCPVCALVAAVRGESTELGRRLAEQGSGVLVAVRTLLEEHGDTTPTSPPADGAGAAAAGPVQVQRIPVRRGPTPR